MPRVIRVRVIFYFLPADLQVLEEIAREVGLDGFCQFRRIAWLAKKSGAALDNFLAERSHIGRHYWQAKAVGQEQHTALKYLLIRKNQNIGPFEVQLHFLVGNELDPQDDL